MNTEDLVIFVTALTIILGPGLFVLIWKVGTRVIVLSQASIFFICLFATFFAFVEADSFSHRDGGGWPSLIAGFGGIVSFAIGILVLLSALLVGIAAWINSWQAKKKRCDSNSRN